MHRFLFKREYILVFVKAQFSSIVSTLADFLITRVLVEMAGCWYLPASILGTISGGCLNFCLGRNWVFQEKNKDRLKQAFRYLIIWTGSLLLNTAGVYLLTSVIGFHYMISKAITAVSVGVFFNYYFQKSYVFGTR